jgi:hypothetical protein
VKLSALLSLGIVTFAISVLKDLIITVSGLIIVLALGMSYNINLSIEIILSFIGLL